MKRIAWAAVVLMAVVAGGLQPMAVQLPPFGGPAEYVADLARRRAKLMATVGSESVLVFWSAPQRVYSGDMNYEYRQDSNLLYLTGLQQDETILVLVPGARTQKEFLFVRAADPMRTLWAGPVLTPAEVTAASGVANVFAQRDTEVFDAFMTGLLSGKGYGQPQVGAAAEFPEFVSALTSGKARVGVAERFEDSGRRSLERPERDARNSWAREIERRFSGVKVFDSREILNDQRQIKTLYEQQVLKRSVEISAEAHVEGMRATQPGRWEYEIEAVIEAWFHKNGALTWGYPSIVGSGPNAMVLHYVASTRQMQSGDLLLVDAAGSFQGLTGDITRTYPVSGRFSNEQRAVYDLVLRAQEAGIAAARPGRPVEEIDAAVRSVVVAGLPALGLVSSTATGSARDAEVDLWYPHGPTHGIGMDVHESLSTLEPGTAFVIEPGIYIHLGAFDRLPKTSEAAAMTARLRPMAEKYRNIGIRIEDSFLMTPSGPVMLSAKAPRRTVDIERTVGKGR